jgi:nucleoside 2-deoxyribosyltransferase
MKIYVASSWRNQIQQEVVVLLREQGFEVYDFKNPSPGNHGFHWSEIDPNWKKWTPAEFKQGLKHDIALAGFYSDMNALDECDVCVLVLPSGRSAHLEAGWAIGANKPTIIYIPEAVEPELMYLMAPFICTEIQELLSTLNDIKIDLRRCRVCGCTDDNACFGGCYWVADDLCSACVAHHGGEVEKVNENTR